MVNRSRGRRSVGLICLAVLLALVLGSCANWLSPGTQSGGQKGTVSITVPHISPVLQKLAAASKTAQGSKGLSSGKAFIGADRVEFQLYKWNSTYQSWDYADSWSVTPTNPAVFQGPETPVYVEPGKSLFAGDYMIYAYLYNYGNSTDMYTVYGTETFTVNPNEATSVAITCTPYVYGDNYLYYEYMTYGQYQLTATWSQDAYGNFVTGSETWYSVYPTTATTTFSAVPVEGSSATLMAIIFDQYGHYVAGGQSQPAPGAASRVRAPTEAYYQYYMVVLDMGDPNATNRGFTIEYEPYTPPPAIDLPVGTSYQTAPWSQQYVAQSGETWLRFQGTPGATYKIEWDDSYQGSGTYVYGQGGADIYVFAYHSDQSTTFFTYADTGYNQPRNVTVGSDGWVYIKVVEYSSGYSYGNFAMKVYSAGY